MPQDGGQCAHQLKVPIVLQKKDIKMVQGTTPTAPTRPVGDVIKMQENPTSASTSQPKAKAAKSNLPTKLSAKAQGKQTASDASGVLPLSHLNAMAPAAVPQRVHPLNLWGHAKEHFLPSAPQNVHEILGVYEEAIKEVRESRPIDVAKYDAFQVKKSKALDLEFDAAVKTNQLKQLQEVKRQTDKALDVADLPESVREMVKDGLSALSPEGLKAAVAEMEKSEKKAWKDVVSAWDDALVDYLDAHKLDRKPLEAGFKRAGSPAYASRVAAPAAMSALIAIPSFIHASTPAGRLLVSGVGAAATLGIAGIAQPLTNAATTLAAVTWSDRLFNYAPNIQNLLGTKMIDQVDEQLKEVQVGAGKALQAWDAAKTSKDPKVREGALQKLQSAMIELEGANHEYLLRADLNRVYLQGFGGQGINNGGKYYFNSSLGPIGAKFGSTVAGSMQLGIAGGLFSTHMMISGNDEKNKQLRMMYLRMRASGPRPGEEREETLQNFRNEIRDPFEVAGGALAQIFTARVGVLDTEIAKTLKLKPNEWELVVKLNKFESEGNESGVFDGDLDQARNLRTTSDATKNTLDAKKRKELDEKIDLRNDTARDIPHVASGALSQVSAKNEAEVWQGFQFTPPSSSKLGALKDFVTGPVTPEFRIGMKQGLARMRLPQEVMTTYGLAFWSAFQLGICGENGPLILSKLAGAFMAIHKYRTTGESPTEKENLVLQSTLTAVNLMVTGALIYSSFRLLNIVPHPKTVVEKISQLAGGKSSAANTTYLGALLRDREPQRAERAKTDADAGFQKTGLGAGFGNELWPTLGKRLAVLVQEAVPAGDARKHFFESVEMLNVMKKEILQAHPELAEDMEKKTAELIDDLATMHGALQEDAGPSDLHESPESELPEEREFEVTTNR